MSYGDTMYNSCLQIEHNSVTVIMIKLLLKLIKEDEQYQPNIKYILLLLNKNINIYMQYIHI